MKDLIDCPDCGGQLVRESELEDCFICDVCECKLENGVIIPKLAEITQCN